MPENIRYLETNKDTSKDWGTVHPIDDARLYATIFGDRSGVVRGCECTSLGGNIIRISAGWGIIQGRRWELPAQEIAVQLGEGSSPQEFKLFVYIDSATVSCGVGQYQGTNWNIAEADTVSEGHGQSIAPIATYYASNALVTEVKLAQKLDSVGVVRFKTPTIPSATSEWSEITSDNQAFYGLADEHGFKYARLIPAGDMTCYNGFCRFNSAILRIVNFFYEPTDVAATNTTLQKSAGKLASGIWKRIPEGSSDGVYVIVKDLPPSDISLIVETSVRKEG